eukprot:TRINITY_DN2343_c0_g1_i1.p1 TRINITY_DN2343_c0_g1~~TRINITY_DN2343_c0_g1_i1.p1  ORF type:complete len:142 (+),score=15.72 TRINITY_DN2343_c0_g1_i1:846-1271(+)
MQALKQISRITFTSSKAAPLRARPLPLTSNVARSTVFSSMGSFFSIGQRSFGGHAHVPLEEKDAEARVLKVLQGFHRFDPSVQIRPESSFSQDLGLDSLDSVEVVMAFEDEFAIEIPDTDADKFRTPKDVINYLVKHPLAK